MNNKKKKKRKLSKKKIFIFFIFIIIILFVIKLFNTNITNIYIKGNIYLSDQEIIDICELNDYPNSIKNMSFNLEKKLLNNANIYKANVTKNILLNKVYIEISENYPLFYYLTKEKTILYDGTEIDDVLTNITVVNSISNDIYNKFIKQIKKIDIDVLNRISEIEYAPTDLIKERFLILMNDGNYVYITISKFQTINKYIDIIKEFDGNKGILYLDSGGYFDVFDK